MKTLKSLAIAGMLLIFANSAFAATATLNVEAIVNGTCSFAAASTLLDFTTIDPTLGTDATASTTIDYTCTAGTPYTTIFPAAVTIANGVNTIGVNLAYAETGTGTGTGTVETITIDGTIPAANFATSPAGTYTGNITIEVNP